MQRLFSLGLLTFLVISCSSVNSTAPTPKGDSAETYTPTPIAQSTSKPATAVEQPTPTNQNIYPSTKFGFRFEYPNNYVVDSSKANQQPKPNETLQGIIEIWKSADYKAIKSKNFEGGEFPPNISIHVHSNANQLTLAQWKDRLSIGSSKARTITVAGQTALTFTSTGLYELDNVLVSSPDGRHVIHLSVGHFNASDPSRQVFQGIVSSFKFDS